MVIFSWWEEAAGGWAAGVVGTLLGYPLDAVKTSMQTQPTPSPVRPSSSSQASIPAQGGMMGTAAHMWRTGGPRSFYQGVVPPLISLSILNTLNFAAYSTFQDWYGARKSNWDVRNAMAGASCGPFASVISTVENLLKTQLQLDQKQPQQGRKYRGAGDCLWQLLRSPAQHQSAMDSSLSSTRAHRPLNFSVLYTGHGVNTAREATFLLVYFYMYEGFRHQLISLQAQPQQLPPRSTTTSPSFYPNVAIDRVSANNSWAIPVAGGLAGAMAWTVSFPLDCVRAGVQGQDLWIVPSQQSKKSSWQVFHFLMETKGWRGLYAGVTPSIVRAFIVSGSRFSAYEATLWFLRGGRDGPVL